MSDRICIHSKGQQQVHVSSGMALTLSLKAAIVARISIYSKKQDT
jgi:hypothetical protein